MFDLNPLNLPDAQWQHISMAVVAGMLGFIIGYVGRQSTARQLEGELTTLDRELADCQSGKPALSSDPKIAALNRIRARTDELNFERIGLATAAEADDLKEIVGIGPFLEEKLHAIGVYTFRQIANFTPEDVEKITDIIEFFPGRIMRDNWVGQAAELARRR